MCRIAGLLSEKENGGAVVQLMTDLQSHGGPDGRGVRQIGAVAFGHCRLAIIAPGEEGAQPFADGDDLLTYNGELYNYRELRSELRKEGCTFRTDTDTEVILRALQQWGDKAPARFNGMFALAYWSGAHQSLLLARDHVGMKPLYYGQCGKDLVFASELGALRAHPDFSGAIDKTAVASFLRRGYVGAPATIYADFRKVKPGTVLTFSLINFEPSEHVFYPMVSDHQVSREEDFEAVFMASCTRHLIADVPVGVLLSGGVDSALLAASVASVRPEPPLTFTLGFENPRFDEAPMAEAVANHLGTRHRTFYVGQDELIGALDQLTTAFGEPFGDASALPTLLLAERVAQEVKCVLGGDGGDEVFGGYAKYRATLAFSQYGQNIPGFARGLVAGGVNALRPDRLARWQNLLGRGNKNLEDRYYKMGESLSATKPADFFMRASSYSGQEVLSRLGVTDAQFMPDWSGQDLLAAMARQDLRHFMEGDLMVKTDRAAMRYGLEVRFPFLDREVIDYGLGLSAEQKIRRGLGKVLLRKALAKSLPAGLINRGKDGFSIPLQGLLMGLLSVEVRALGKDTAFARRFGLFSAGIDGVVSDFLSRRSYVNAYPVWFLLVLYRWHQAWPE